MYGSLIIFAHWTKNSQYDQGHNKGVREVPTPWVQFLGEHKMKSQHYNGRCYIIYLQKLELNVIIYTN